MNYTKRLIAKASIYRLKAKKLEQENKLLWDLIHELQRLISKITELKREERKKKETKKLWIQN